MRALPLTTIKGGINRLRTKGGARPDNLYDLLNGYVTEAGNVKVRPGSERIAELDPLTRGLCAFGGQLHVFCHVPVTVPDGFVLNVLAHPDPPDLSYAYGYRDPYAEDTVPLNAIYFAEPFLGGLYVVAEFEDGAVYHYWLQPGATWEAETIYSIGGLVQPTTPNGFAYRATRLTDPEAPWQPDEPRYDGIGDYYAQSVVEPTVANGYYYVCVETQGPNPRSGTTEPTWPTVEGEQVIERTDTGLPEETQIDSTLPPSAGPSTDPTPTNPDPTDRYDYTGGSGGGGGSDTGTIGGTDLV